MDAVVKVVRGQDLKATSCSFCNKHDNVKVFAIVDRETYDGHQIRAWGICEEHFDKLNALLSGEFDIDNIKAKQYSAPGNVINFR